MADGSEPERAVETAATPTFSISIEWENARFADLERTRRLLRRLREELCELPTLPQAPQVAFLFDRFSMDGDLVERTVEEELRPRETPARVTIIPTDGLRYYQQKNLGAASSDGEIVIFLDCDVVPEQGWLRSMLDAFADPTVAVVGGETYVELDGLVGKAFALFWLFALRDPGSGLAPADFFHANNVAFRRSVFAAQPFPDAPIYRGQCTLLSASLLARGLGLFRLKSGRAAHPHPRTLSYFMARALNGGHDFLMVERILGRGESLSWRRLLSEYRGRLRYGTERILAHRRDVGLSRAGAAAALAIAFAYFSLFTLGEAVSIDRPRLIPRLLPI